MLGKMILWKVLADAVMVFHLLLIVFFIVSAILLAVGVFKGHHNWQLFYWSVIALVLGFWVTSWTRILKSCSLTDWEYMLRRLYDPSESWMRPRSLLASVIFNITGIGVPEFVFTIAVGVAIVVMIVSLIVHRA
jgi:hypothetical protein